MKYLIFQYDFLARARNHQEFLSRADPDFVPVVHGDTIFQWTMTEHPTDGRVAIHIPPEDEAGLSASEQAALLDTLTEDWYADA